MRPEFNRRLANDSDFRVVNLHGAMQRIFQVHNEACTSEEAVEGQVTHSAPETNLAALIDII